MASDSWISRFSTSSRRYQTRSDLHEETEAEEDLKAEYLCPFCAEDFDVVGLFCHIDEDHPVEAKNGVCPVCAKRVGMDIVSHITGQHGNFFKISFYLKFDFVTFNVLVQIFCIICSPLSSLTGDYVQRKRRLRKGGANSAFSILRKELREGSLQSLLGGSSCFVSSSNSEPDPLLSPFIFNPPGFDEAPNAKPLSSVEASSVKGSTTEEFLESVRTSLNTNRQGWNFCRADAMKNLLWMNSLSKKLALLMILWSLPVHDIHQFSVVGEDYHSVSKFGANRKVQPHLSDKDQEEKSRKSEFVRGLLLSTILDDEL
ncbi:hypothetical protein POTOM_035202 [Populus tomentosa]|uniref:Drought-responsive family protein n=1 Tax=Populus tomentosa TaxID=118781 RepID=A0A8X7YYF4_POPTO|nr:hypothetical protein POTOM_035202 [Populus tomentosa]